MRLKGRIVLFVMLWIQYVAAHDVESRSVKKDLAEECFGDDTCFSKTDYKDFRILSRKRRYLTFPSGSSFQLVYDLIVGVVDYTNYLILGVTSALAWPLPSEPPSEILDDLKQKLEDGTLDISRNDSIQNIRYVDTKSGSTHKQTYITSKTQPWYQKTQYYAHRLSNNFRPPPQTSYYSVRHNPFAQWHASGRRAEATSWHHPKLTPSFRRPVYNTVRNHRIYPVFAKRDTQSKDPHKRHGINGIKLNDIEKIHLKYHRSTRHDLFAKIEKYLETHNKNGHQCVLKALCETGKKMNEVTPGTFVGEIMRAIFTLPENVDRVLNDKHRLYDEAHAHDGSCIDKYPLCPESLWEQDFIF